MSCDIFDVYNKIMLQLSSHRGTADQTSEMFTSLLPVYLSLLNETFPKTFPVHVASLDLKPNDLF